MSLSHLEPSSHGSRESRGRGLVAPSFGISLLRTGVDRYVFVTSSFRICCRNFSAPFPQLSVLPSHMSGDVVLIRGGARVDEVLNSMSHGTGQKMSRSDSKPFADSYDYSSLRSSILIPDGVDNSSLRTDGPFAYRDLDECLSLIGDYIEVVARFEVIGYMGHLG